jgi:VCBS repeat protein
VTTDNNLNISPGTQSVALSGTATTGTTVQTITFPQPASPVSSGDSAMLTATSSSGLAVFYTVTGPATISGSIVTCTGPGTVVVTANQDGNGTYAVATPVSVTILVNAAKSKTTIASLTLTTATIDVFGFGSTPPSGTLAVTDTTTGNPVTAPITLNTAKATTALTSQVTTSTGGNTLPDWTTLGDINGDGKLDLVTSVYQTNSVRVQLGNGDGTFQAATTILIAAGFGPSENHLVSLRGNGTLDLIAASFNTNQIAVLLGNGDGTFQSPVFYTVGSASNTPTSLTTGDFNHDGMLDVAVANTGDNTVSILLGTGSGALTPSGSAVHVGTDPEAIRAADFNGDGFSDLAVANYLDGTVTILLNNQDGGFAASVISVGTGAGSGPQALAIEGAGNTLLLAVANFRDNSVSVLRGDGSGAFGAQTIIPAGGGPDDVVFADFNGNGIPDMAVSNYTTGTVSLMMGSAGGSYAVLGPFKVSNTPYSVAVGDLDLDGTPDIVVPNCFSNNTGVLLTGTQISVPYTGLLMTPGDTLDATYAPDVASQYSGSISPGVIAP